MVRRFESQFDPDELAKITHRGLKPLSHSNEPKIDQAEVSTLKVAARSESSSKVQARRLFDQLFGGIISSFKALFAPKQKKVTQCQNYGHVLKSGWTGELPRCTDCHEIITSPDQVRGASLKNQTNYGDDQAQSGRRYVK